MRYPSVISVLAVSAVACSSPAAAQCSPSPSNSSPVALSAVSDRPSDLVDTAVAAGSFTTLTAALKAAGLVDALKGDGPFTVFAPTDEAFAKLPDGTVASLLEPDNRDTLVAILTYHVVEGNMPASRVVSMSGAQTLNGQRLDFAVNDRNVRIDNASVITSDVRASNGVIHVIDTVMMPNMKDVVATADEAGAFTTLLAAAKAAGLLEALKGDGPMTIFAPTDEAFAKLGSSTIESLLMPEAIEKLREILLYHVVPGRLYADAVASQQGATTLAGQSVSFSTRGNAVMVDSARVVSPNIDATNGVIHVIDTVLMPE